VSEPEAGVMHPVDRAFYDLTVQQRDAAWRTIEVLREKLDAVQEALPDPGQVPQWGKDDYREAVRRARRLLYDHRRETQPTGHTSQ
jgi:hypothetical protein